MRAIFDVSFTTVDNTRRARHGAPWTPWELERLRTLFQTGIGLKPLCLSLQRPATGVVPKLLSMGLITFDADTGRYLHTKTDSPNSTTSTKEPSMSQDNSGFKTIPLYNGRPADTLDDETIMSALQSIADKQKHLDAFPFPSQKVDNMKKKLSEDAANLLAYWEARA